MKKKKLETQYNQHAEKYSKLHVGENQKSTKKFFAMISKHVPYSETKSLKLIDLGCGSGADFNFYLKRKFECFGLDASSEMFTMVQQMFKDRVTMRQGSFIDNRELHFNKSFDVVVSKWAMQTVPNIQKVYEQVVRILKPEGYFIFLTTHPLRQFLEKKKKGKNYFKKEIVISKIFNKQIVLNEPSHTLQEYLSPYFFEKFNIIEFVEDYDKFPAAEQIGGDIYPTHLIVVARKK